MRMSRRMGVVSGGAGFAIPLYTGSFAVFGDKTQGRIELYSSGTLTLSKGDYSVFMVGGGGGGASSVSPAGGGGGGGYTVTSSLSLENKTVYNVLIGAGGSASSDGGQSQLSSSIYAPGGYGGYRASGSLNDQHGSCGGSGGGEGSNSGNVQSRRNGGAGGTDGGNGYGQDQSIITTGTHFIGQGTTTRAFGELSGTLYAGGGGGGASYVYGAGTGGAGGLGGGGAGGSGGNTSHPGNNGNNGTANTGGGGGGAGGGNKTGGSGGSGIIILRWGYAA